MDETGTCSSCYYWDLDNDKILAKEKKTLEARGNDSGHLREGKCRRYPPAGVPREGLGAGSAAGTHWSRSIGSDWCGEWVPQRVHFEVDLWAVFEGVDTMSEAEFLEALNSLASTERKKVFRTLFTEEERKGHLLLLEDEPFYALYRQRVATYLTLQKEEEAQAKEDKLSTAPLNAGHSAGLPAAQETGGRIPSWQDLLASAAQRTSGDTPNGGERDG